MASTSSTDRRHEMTPARSSARRTAAVTAAVALALSGSGAGVAAAEDAPTTAPTTSAPASSAAPGGLLADPLGSLGGQAPLGAGSLDEGSLGGTPTGSAVEATTQGGAALGSSGDGSGSAAGVLGGAGLGADLGAGSTGSVAPTTAPEDTTAGRSAAPTSTNRTYAETALPPGTFDPDALGRLSPQTIGVVGTAAAVSLASAALSLGPLGPSTASAAVGGLIPGVAYVPGAGSLASAGSGEFTTSVGFTVSENTIIQTVVGAGFTTLGGYFEAMADKQEAAELTEQDIDTWDSIIRGIDELRAVFSLPPIPRSDPHVQVAIPEPCRRNYPEENEITQDEADELCEQAKAEEAAKAPEQNPAENPDGTPAASPAETPTRSPADEVPATGPAPAPAAAPMASPVGARAEAQAPTAAPRTTQLADEAAANGTELAFTGTDAGIVALGALGLVAVGGAFLFLGRRKES